MSEINNNAQLHDAHLWRPEDVILASLMNDIENSLAGISKELIDARSRTGQTVGTLKNRLDDMFIMSNSQPDNPNNEIWVNTDTNSSVIEIPTMDDISHVVYGCEIDDTGTLYLRDRNNNIIGGGIKVKAVVV